MKRLMMYLACALAMGMGLMAGSRVAQADEPGGSYRCSDCEWRWSVLQDWCNTDATRDGSGTCEMYSYHGGMSHQCRMIDEVGCCIVELSSAAIGGDGSVAYARTVADGPRALEDGLGRVLLRAHSGYVESQTRAATAELIF
jgi:hypothetical protein